MGGVLCMRIICYSSARGATSDEQSIQHCQHDQAGQARQDSGAEPAARATEGEQARQSWKPKPFLMPIRVAISGKTQTPPLFPMLAALGRDRSLKRLRDAIDLLETGALP